MTPERLAELFTVEELQPISRESDPSWRHGTRETWVFEPAPGVFWEASFRLSTDGETHELREGCAGVRRVYPVTETVTAYRSAPSVAVDRYFLPWETLASFWVAGIPKGQPRTQAAAFTPAGGGAPRARVFTPGTAEAWKGDVVRAAEPSTPKTPIDEACKLDVAFYLKRPKRLMRKKDPAGPIRHDGKPDVDNLYKAVADTLENLGFFDDDKRVCDSHVRSFFHSKTGRPGARIRVMVERAGLAQLRFGAGV